MSADSTRKTILMALAVCLVCSILVSTAAVGLKSIQDNNKELDKLKNILIAGNIYEDNVDIHQLFSRKIKAGIVDLKNGEPLPPEQYTDKLHPDVFDVKTMARDPEFSRPLDIEEDIAQIKWISRYMVYYQVVDNDRIESIILPVYGKGLWSTMYGFIALAQDLNTVKGFTFYEHGETPGLGGEVDNPAWKASWIGKKIYNTSGQLKIEVIKDKVEPGGADAKYQVDGLSGATITTRGVNALVRFWLGENGYDPFLEGLRNKGWQ